MNNEKRLFMAIALSILLILGYQSYMRRFAKPYQRMDKNTTQETVVSGTASVQHGLEATVSSQPAYRTPEEITTFENEIYHAVFTNHGAAIKELYMLRHNGKPGEPILLARAEPGTPPILATEDTMAQAGPLAWQLKEIGRESVTYVAENEDQRLQKRFDFHNSNYIIELELKIINKKAKSEDIRYKIIGSQANITGMQMDDMHAGADAKVNGKIYRQKPNLKKEQESKLLQGLPEWASVRSRYFSFVLKPEQEEQGAFIESVNKKTAWSGIMLGPVAIQPYDTVIHKYLFYAGPNDPNLMKPLNIPPKELIGFWVSSGIANLLLRGVRFFYGFTKNYGIAIILLTIVISAILTPLTRKSMKSMKDMQKIQPEAEKIKKAYKDNPQKMNKEIMELYKKHKINPMGGCLPMFLQFPIFVSLFQVLPRCIDLKGANFLWIKDLSSPDALLKLPALAKLPVIQGQFNLLPILMAMAMAVQQKVSHPGGEVSDQQRTMAIVMPIMFGFIFYNMASSLVLYWLTNTIFTLLIQEVILKSRQPATDIA